MLLTILLVAPHLLLAVVLHEIAHGVAALALGDDTAKRAGRITLNPLKHVDPFMTVILPGLLIAAGSPVIFGGAKPVPVDFSRLGSPRRDSALVAVAGPVVNFALALLWILAFRLLYSPESPPSPVMAEFFVNGTLINTVLAVFNLTPIPPLDGGRILVAALPRALALRVASVEKYGFLIVIALLSTGALRGVLELPLEIALDLMVGQEFSIEGSPSSGP